MSTSGRINKHKGKFQPRRPIGTAGRSNQSSVTPKQLTVELPRLEEAEDEDHEPSRLLAPSPNKVTKPAQKATNLSAFAPSDPSQRSPSSPSSSPNRSQPQSSFGFGTQNTLTQATSVGGSSQAILLSPPISLPVPPPLPASSPSDSSRRHGIPLGLPIVSVEAVPEGSTEDKGKGKSKSKGKDKGKGKERADQDEEIVTSKRGKRRVSSRSAFSARPKRLPSRFSTRIHDEEEEEEEENDDDEEEEEEDQLEEEVIENRPARVPKTARRTKVQKAQKVTEDGESSEDEWDTMKKKKRRSRKAPKKRGVVDEMLFGDDDSDDSSPDDGEYSPGEGDGSGSDRDGGKRKAQKRVAPPRKENEPERKQKKQKQKRGDSDPLPPVNPTQTTMSQLAAVDPDFEIGRPSERTLFFEKQKVDKKEAMKLKRIKMKQRRDRRIAGLPSDSEAEGQEGAGVGDNGTNSKGKEKAGSKETSPQVLDAAKAMALIGGARQDGDDDDEPSGGEGAGGGEIATTPKDGEEEDAEEEAEEEDGDDYGDLAETTFAPQMRIVDGVLVLDEDSLQIDRSKPTDTGPREVIEESAQDRFVNSRSFSKKPGKSRKWTTDDTERFYDALSQFGTDFELISALFPGRTRREIKLKWTKEDKINPKGITAALMRRKKIDLESYAKFSGQDLTGPTPADPMDEINERRAKLEAEGHSTGGAGHRRGQDSSHGTDKKMKGKKKRGPIDEAGAALFDENAIAREREEEERRRLEEEQAEEERQARIDAMEAEEDDD
ncbi:hypothetical protein JCM3765_003903 [Sporobolomyces pararoseus]